MHNHLLQAGYTRSSLHSDTQAVNCKQQRVSMLNALLVYENHFRGPKAVAYLCLMGKFSLCVRLFVCVCVCERESLSVCVCVCVCECE